MNAERKNFMQQEDDGIFKIWNKTSIKLNILRYSWKSAQFVFDKQLLRVWLVLTKRRSGYRRHLSTTSVANCTKGMLTPTFPVVTENVIILFLFQYLFYKNEDVSNILKRNFLNFRPFCIRYERVKYFKFDLTIKLIIAEGYKRF